jgi:hypothetical protein
MPQVLYFQITLEPHHKRSSKKTGREGSLLLAEVPLSATKAGKIARRQAID